MAHWIYTLDVSDLWKPVKNDEKELIDLIKAIIERLEALKIQGDAELEEIIEEFKLLSELPFPDEEEFDGIWDRLYDWADDGHKCWIKTF